VCDDGIDCTEDMCAETTRNCRFLPPDVDADGNADIRCLKDDGQPFGQDCDDNDALRFPGNHEICDEMHHDEDCDPSTNGEKDSDGDGYFDNACCNRESDAEGAGLLCGEDCDDLKQSVNPRSPEVCDNFDNNCNGETDEGVTSELFIDRDFDGHGDIAALAK